MESNEQLWYPPQQEGFGPWIEHDGGGMPVPRDARVNVLKSYERYERRFRNIGWAAAHWAWGTVVAYCVKLDEKPAPVESGGDDVLVELRRLWSIYGEEAVNRVGFDVGLLAGQRWTMAHLSIAADLLAASKPKADPNAAMLARDLVNYPVSKPRPIAKRVPVNPFLVCAPWTNRFGGWGAS